MDKKLRKWIRYRNIKISDIFYSDIAIKLYSTYYRRGEGRGWYDSDTKLTDGISDINTQQTLAPYAQNLEDKLYLHVNKHKSFPKFLPLYMSWGVMAGQLAWGGLIEEGWRKGPWTAEEDRLLIEYVRLHGDGRWSSVARLAGLYLTHLCTQPFL